MKKLMVLAVLAFGIFTGCQKEAVMCDQYQILMPDDICKPWYQDFVRDWVVTGTACTASSQDFDGQVWNGEYHGPNTFRLGGTLCTLTSHTTFESEPMVVTIGGWEWHITMTGTLITQQSGQHTINLHQFWDGDGFTFTCDMELR